MSYRVNQAIRKTLEAIVLDYPGSRDALEPVIYKMEHGIALEPNDTEEVSKWLEWVAENYMYR